MALVVFFYFFQAGLEAETRTEKIKKIAW